MSIVYWTVFTKKKENKILSIEEEIGKIEEPDYDEKKKLDKEYRYWKIATIVVTVIALGIYLIPMFFI